MDAAPFRFERLGSQDRTPFSCEDEALNRYLRDTATRDQQRLSSFCSLCIEQASGTIAGYFTLSNASIGHERFPQQVRDKLPPYAEIPATLIGRLARDLRFAGRGIGGVLLTEAASTVMEGASASMLLLVDAYPTAVAFYRRFGFCPLPPAEGAAPSDTVLLYYPVSQVILIAFFRWANCRASAASSCYDARPST